MKILIRDDYLGISDFSKSDLINIKEEFSEKDLSLAITKNGFDKRKIKNVCFARQAGENLILRTGFLKDLVELCKKEDIKITEIKDIRTKFPHQKKDYSYEELKSYFDPKFKYVDHQIRAVKAMLKTNVGICKLPTSAGKSTILSVFLRMTNLSTLIIVDGVTLSEQLRESLIEDGIDCGICHGKTKIIKPVMVSTMGSVKKIPDFTKFQCLVIDEVHGAAARTYQEFLSITNFPLRFGLSATPEGNSPFRWITIRQFLGNIISETHSDELMDNDVITPPEIHFKKVDCKPTMDWESAYEKNIVFNDERNKMAIDLAKNDDGSVLILFKLIEHGELLSKALPESILLHGDHSIKERKEAVDKFKNGEVRILIASNIFKQGISINNIETLINVSGGKSKIEVLQKLGRALRKHKGKEKALIYDFMDTGNRFTEGHSLKRMSLYKKAGYTDIHED